MNTQLYIGIMSGTSMDGADAVLIRMQGNQWQGALAHAFTPYSDDLRQELLNLQNIGDNELHRSNILSQTLSRLYAQTVHTLLSEQNLPAEAVTAVGCHGQTVRHAPEHGYSIQLADLPLLAELTGIFTIGDFRSRDLASGGQGAPLVNKIADHAHQHSGKDSINQLQVGTHLSLSHRISFLKNCGCVSDYCNLFAIFLETFIYLRRAKYLTNRKTALKCFFTA